jgi:lysophospholipase L1-like esterase
MIRLLILQLSLLACCLSSTSVDGADINPIRGKKRILFLGDSITHSGGFVAWIETQLRLQSDEVPVILNVGLSSETCSGLSEPDHPFPRPEVHTRLDAALAKVQPDLVFACYGMNDGIYYPFSEDRFKAYQVGVNKLIKKVHASGAKLVLMTPSPFDPTPLRGTKKIKPKGEAKYAWFSMYENYDAEVLARYAAWIMEQKGRVEKVIDLHTPMLKYATKQRISNPKFTLTPDGIHPDAMGHRIIGQTISKSCGLKHIEPDAKLLQVVNRKMVLLHDAWLSHVGHKRPGVKAGLPLKEAEEKATELEQEINALVVKARQNTK